MTVAANPAAVLAAQIAALGTLNGVALAAEGDPQGNVFVGEVRVIGSEVPPLSVFVKNVRGLKPQPYLGNIGDFVQHQVDVTVRSDPAGYTAAEQLARDLMYTLHRTPPTGYITSLLQQAGPDYRGETNEREHLFGFVIELWLKTST